MKTHISHASLNKSLVHLGRASQPSILAGDPRHIGERLGRPAGFIGTQLAIGTMIGRGAIYKSGVVMGAAPLAAPLAANMTHPAGPQAAWAVLLALYTAAPIQYCRGGQLTSTRNVDRVESCDSL